MNSLSRKTHVSLLNLSCVYICRVDDACERRPDTCFKVNPGRELLFEVLFIYKCSFSLTWVDFRHGQWNLGSWKERHFLSKRAKTTSASFIWLKFYGSFCQIHTFRPCALNISFSGQSPGLAFLVLIVSLRTSPRWTKNPTKPQTIIQSCTDKSQATNSLFLVWIVLTSSGN